MAVSLFRPQYRWLCRIVKALIIVLSRRYIPDPSMLTCYLEPPPTIDASNGSAHLPALRGDRGITAKETSVWRISPENTDALDLLLSTTIFCYNLRIHSNTLGECLYHQSTWVKIKDKAYEWSVTFDWMTSVRNLKLVSWNFVPH